MAYDNTNKGILSKNDRKTQETHPDITGSINVDGQDYWLNGWQKKRKDGSGSFYSLSVKPKEQKAAPPQQAPLPTGEFLDDDIPF